MPVSDAPAAGPANPTIADVQRRVFDPACASCHTGSRPPGNLRLGRALNPEELRDTLLTRPTSATGMPYVTPGDLSKSFLAHKVHGTQGALTCPARRGCGLRMPPAGALPSDKLELLERWIEQGAK